MTNSSPATLLLVDDQTMLLDGMEALVATMPMVQVVGRSNSGQEAIEKAILLKPDLVLMDVNMPGMDGIEATKRLLKESPESRVLVLSMYGHKEFVLEVLDAGAYGYMLKNAGKAELITALTEIINGRKYVTPELDALIKQGDQHKDRQGENGHCALTKREIQIVKLILQQYTTQEIAQTLFLSPDTVDTHRRNMMHKLDVRNAAGLVKYAMERGWG